MSGFLLDLARGQRKVGQEAMGLLAVSLVGAAYHTPQPPHWFIPAMAIDARELLEQVYQEAMLIAARGDNPLLELGRLLRKYTSPPFRELTYDEERDNGPS